MDELVNLEERKQQLRSLLLELNEVHGSTSLQWSDLEAEIAEREANLKRQFEELSAKERDFEVRSKQVLGTIEERVRSVAECESRLNLQEEQQQEQNSIEVPAAAGLAKIAISEAAPSPVKAEVRVRPFLKSLCENMDGEGLRMYVVDHRKDMGALRNEVPAALQNFASEPARLVLSAVQGYYHLDNNVSSSSSNSNSNRRACILLLEALASAVSSGMDYHPELRSLARDLAEQWRSGMDIHDAPDGHSLDAQAFLQLLATFGLASEFDEEELCSLVLAVARRKQTPALCRALNLSHKIPEIVQQLASDGRQIEALLFAHAFEIMDQVQPVALLKAYLKDARQRNGENGTPQPDFLSKELAALKDVLKCIEDYKLEVEYPPSPLQKRAAHLEKMKSERKRTGGYVKGQSKRPRNGGYGRGSYYRSSERNQQQQQQQQQVYSNVSVSPYALIPQARPAGYAPYAAAPSVSGPPSTRAAPPQLVYSVDGSVYSPNLYGTQAASFSNYQIAGLLQQPYQPAYKPAYMH